MSRLRARLAALQDPAASPADNNDLRGRLAARGRGRAPRRPDDTELARRLGARVLAPGLLLVEESLRPNARHGDVGLRPTSAALDYFGATADPGRTLYLDTETSGLAGGTGTVAFLVGVARFRERRLWLRQWLLSGHGGEAALLAALTAELADAELLVSFNGRSFDVPLLITRYALQRQAEPLSRLTPLDLLHLSRRAFSRHWPDCRLASVEQRLLGVRRDDDLPGSAVPAVWRAWLTRGCSRELPRVLHHNRWDLLSLAALPLRLAMAYARPRRWGADCRAAAKLLLEQGDARAALAHLQAQGPWLEAADTLALADLALRCGEPAVALGAWERLARDDHPTALGKLAGYFERRQPDPARALDYTRRKLALDPDDTVSRRREARLLARLERG